MFSVAQPRETSVLTPSMFYPKKCQFVCYTALHSSCVKLYYYPVSFDIASLSCDGSSPLS